MTAQPSDRLTQLRPLDVPDPEGLAAAHDLVTSRIAAQDVPDLRDRLPRHRPRAARVGLVGAAAAAVAAVTLLVPNPSDPVAFAGWTAVPATLTGDDLAAAGAQCLALREEAAGGAQAAESDGTGNLAGARPVLGDRRGETTFTVLASDDGLQSCLIGPRVRTSFVATGDGGSTAHSGGTEADGDSTSIGIVGDDTTPTADGASYAAGGVEDVHSDTPWGFGLGRVGADVAEVRVELTDGTSVDASVSDGVWAAWWPSTATVAAVLPNLADGSAGVSPEVDAFDVDTALDGDLTIEQGDAPGGTTDVATDVATAVAED